MASRCWTALHNDIDDEAGFAAACAQGRDFGFDGKTLIHPGQIAPCHPPLRRRDDEVDAARRMLEAFARQSRQGRHRLVDGRMVEKLHAEDRRAHAGLADAIAALMLLTLSRGAGQRRTEARSGAGKGRPQAAWRWRRLWQRSAAFPCSGATPSLPKGLYIWGDVGRGKTLLMDLFFDGSGGWPRSAGPISTAS